MSPERQRGMRILELMHELHGTVGHKLHMDMLAMSWSGYTFHMNFRELERLIAYLTEDEGSFELISLRHRDQLESAEREVARLLHNFVASATSFRLHTTAFRAHWYTDPDRAARVAEKARMTFEDDPESQFLQKLRAYIQHYTMPTLVFIMRGVRGSITRELALPVDELRKWQDWNVASRRYLDSVEDNVPLLALVRSYRERVEEFQQWLVSDVHDLYVGEIADSVDRERELAILQLEDALDAPIITLPSGVIPPKDEVFVSGLLVSGFQRARATPASLTRAGSPSHRASGRKGDPDSFHPPEG